jgi:trigger factor
MKVTTQRLPDSQVILEIEVDPDRVNQSIDQAFKRLAPRTRVPGFRPGKAPRPMIERYLGRSALLREALDHLVPEVFQEAVTEEGIEPIDSPDYEITSLEPVAFKATVPVRPTVELGDYQSLRIERTAVEVSEDEVEENLQELRKRYAHWEPVERPSQYGDNVLADIVGTIEGDGEFVRQEEVEFTLQQDVPTAVPGLLEAIVGIRPGETREFDVAVPADFRDEQMAGKTAHYTVTAHEVKEEKLPELSDEFARRVGEGFATLSLLRESVRTDLRKEAEAEAERTDQDRALDALVSQSTIEYPSILVEREVDHSLGDLNRPVASAQDLQRRLQWAGKSEDELRAEIRSEAEQKVRRSLALTEFAAAEQIEVTPDDIDAEIDRMAEGTTEEQAQQLKAIFGTDNGREVIRRSLFTKAALERLLVIAAPETAEAAASEPARKSPRRAPRTSNDDEEQSTSDQSQENAEAASETAAGS